MSHPEPLSQRAALVATRFTLVWLRRAERAVADRARALDDARFNPFRLSLNIVNDPSGTMQLIGVRGLLHAENVGTLADALAKVGDGMSLHLDVTDATITGAQVLDAIEHQIDQLELRRVRIRIVGLDPRHPAISQRRPR